MALTEAQKIEIRELLQIRQGSSKVDFSRSITTALDEKINALSNEKITEIQEILTQYTAIKYDTGILTGEYSDDPSKKRRLLRDYLMTVLDFNPQNYQNATPFNIERA